MGSVRAGEQILSSFFMLTCPFGFQYDYALFRSSGDWLFICLSLCLGVWFVEVY
jgi:hypothetical protein